jgi:hypothetical protein
LAAGIAAGFGICVEIVHEILAKHPHKNQNPLNGGF